MILCLFIFVACNDKGIPQDHKYPDDQQGIEEEVGKEPGSTPAEKEPDEIVDPIQVIIDEMTLETKIGQVIMPAFRRDKNNQPIQAIDETVKKQIEKYQPGGIILFKENIDTVEQVKKFIHDLQQISHIPLFIGIDEEGGMVSRLHGSGKIPATRLPGNYAIGETKDPMVAYDTGKILGQELFNLGFNMNFAPVADLWTNPNNTVIGKRSFGSDPELAGEMVAAMVKGLQEENISSVIKHFPGHGDTNLDSHHNQVIVDYSKEELEKREWIPFRKGIEAGANGIMIAHIHLPQVIHGDIPATFSKEIMEKILRQELGHEQLLITDALDMGAISKHWSGSEACIKAFEAGADILLMPASLQEGYEGLLKAVEEGQITEERLNQSVHRILKVKKERGLLP